MTERKPPGMNFTSWIDQQIQEAQDRGAFDDLPGAGKPLPTRPADDGLGWTGQKLERKGAPADDLLPPPLKLRKERARLMEAVQDLGSEQEVRDAVSDLNRRIAEWRRIPAGPPVFVPLLDSGEMINRWRAAHPPTARPASRPDSTAGTARPNRRPWRRKTG